MSSFLQNPNAYSGFIDYHYWYKEVDTIWVIVGFCFFVVNMISYIPQPTELAQARSSFGMSSLSAFCSTIAQFFVFVNLVCLHHSDFVGLCQIPFSQSWHRFITFFNVFSAWILYLPIVYQCYVFCDQAKRSTTTTQSQKKDQKMAAFFMIITHVADFVLVAVWVFVSIKTGFYSYGTFNVGRVLGTISAIAEVIYFMPQLYTTCKLRDHGTLSFLMMEIQGPAALINAAYMGIFQGDDFSTYASMLVDGGEQLVMLVTCWVFECLKRKKKDDENDLSQLSVTLLEPVEPLAVSI